MVTYMYVALELSYYHDVLSVIGVFTSTEEAIASIPEHACKFGVQIMRFPLGTYDPAKTITLDNYTHPGMTDEEYEEMQD